MSVPEIVLSWLWDATTGTKTWGSQRNCEAEICIIPVHVECILYNITSGHKLHRVSLTAVRYRGVEPPLNMLLSVIIVTLIWLYTSMSCFSVKCLAVGVNKYLLKTGEELLLSVHHSGESNDWRGAGRNAGGRQLSCLHCWGETDSIWSVHVNTVEIWPPDLKPLVN